MSNAIQLNLFTTEKAPPRLDDARLPARFWKKVSEQDGCWLWIGGRSDLGYPMWWTGTRVRQAYRVCYEALVALVPTGLELDHLCRRPACVNPAHLEPVTHRENLRRGEGPSGVNARKRFCKRGHDLGDSSNLGKGKRYGRECLACRRIRWAGKQQVQYG